MPRPKTHFPTPCAQCQKPRPRWTGALICRKCSGKNQSERAKIARAYTNALKSQMRQPTPTGNPLPATDEPSSVQRVSRRNDRDVARLIDLGKETWAARRAGGFAVVTLRERKTPYTRIFPIQPTDTVLCAYRFQNGAWVEQEHAPIDTEPLPFEGDIYDLL